MLQQFFYWEPWALHSKDVSMKYRRWIILVKSLITMLILLLQSILLDL